jgi:propionyl-CoA carboxylase alpha chain
MIRKILIANRGVSALRIMRTCRRLGIGPVAVYSDDDKESPHARLADEAVSLGPSNGPQVYVDRVRLLDAARRAQVDAVHPGCGFLAADADFAAACETSGLTFIGPSSELLQARAKAQEVAARQEIPVVPAGSWPDAASTWRQIDFQVVGDKHGHVISLCERDVSIQKHRRTLLSESPSPALTDDLRARIQETAVTVAREIGYHNAATVQFLLTPSGEFHWLGIEPFLSSEHAVTEAAIGLDLVELQIAVAEGRRLPDQQPRARGHAIAAALYADEAPGTRSATRTFHVWNPPPETCDLRIDAGAEEGMRVMPFDPLLAQFICADSVRDGAIRKLSQALKTVWAGGVQTDQELLLQVLASQEFQDGNCRLGFLEPYHLKTEADGAHDIFFAAAWALYFVSSRCAQRTILPEVSPNYRNNPCRDPSMTLRIGTKELTISWRHLGRNRYLFHSGESELDGELLALRDGTLAVVLGGIRRDFRFREVADDFFVHSPLGSQVIQLLEKASEIPNGQRSTSPVSLLHGRT